MNSYCYDDDKKVCFSASVEPVIGSRLPDVTDEDEGKLLGVIDRKPIWVLGGVGSGNVSSPEISTIRVMNKADYDALETKSPTTLYFIQG